MVETILSRLLTFDTNLPEQHREQSEGSIMKWSLIQIGSSKKDEVCAAKTQRKLIEFIFKINKFEEDITMLAKKRL